MSSRGGRSYGGDSQRTTLIYQSRTPKPLYPINFLLASPLENLGQEGLRVIRIKRELDAYMRMSPFYLRSGTITAERKRPMMERYSDKYHTESSSIRAGSKSAISGGRGEVHKILADLSAIPGELHSVYDAGRAAKYAQQAAIKSAQTESNSVAQRRKAFLQRLLEAEDNDDNDSVMDDDEEKEERRNSKSRTAMDLDDDDLGLSQEEGEDALEDDTDYALNYFDNGEDYGGGDDEYDGADDTY